MYALPKTKGILRALVLGQRGEISEEVKELFQMAGVSHILTVSGIHVSILFIFVTWLVKASLKWLQIAVNKKLLILFSLPIVWGYISLIEGPPSAFRAGLMFTTAALLVLLYRPFSVINYLFITAFFILLINPADLWSPSFQLSFAATSGILVLAPKLSDFVDRFFAGSSSLQKKSKISIDRIIKWFFFYNYNLYFNCCANFHLTLFNLTFQQHFPYWANNKFNCYPYYKHFYFANLFPCSYFFFIFNPYC